MNYVAPFDAPSLSGQQGFDRIQGVDLTNDPPAAANLAMYATHVYNQHDLLACTAYSVAALMSMRTNIVSKRWLPFDADECFSAVAQSRDRGVSTRVMQYACSPGMLILGEQGRMRIPGFAFAQLGAGQAENVRQVKAALAAMVPVALALLLPVDWDRLPGRSMSTVPGGAYHQVCLTGYDADRVYFVNSLGTAWGDNGFGSMSWGVVTNAAQWDCCYALAALAG